MAAAHHPSAGDRWRAEQDRSRSCRSRPPMPPALAGAPVLAGSQTARSCRESYGSHPGAQRTRPAVLASRATPPVTAYSIPRRRLRRLATLAGGGKRSGRSATISSRASRNSFSASFKAARAFLMRAGLIDPSICNSSRLVADARQNGTGPNCYRNCYRTGKHEPGRTGTQWRGTVHLARGNGTYGDVAG